MDAYNQNNPQYQTGGYANYQGPPGEPMVSPQPYPQYAQPQSQYNQQPYNPQSTYDYPQNNQEMPNYKDEYGTGHDEINFNVRQGFIVKTYGILLSQLALSTIFISLTFIDKVRDLLVFDTAAHPLFLVFFIVFMIVTIVVFVMFICCRETARKVPTNYILLFSYTICMSFFLAIVCAESKPKYVIGALFLTCGATVGLTIYAARTKTDFTYLGGFLFACVLILIISAGLWFWIDYYAFYCAFGVLIYSLYLIYDTQLILGKFGLEYNIDDYCWAALNLYIDIVYLFIKILELLNKN